MKRAFGLPVFVTWFAGVGVAAWIASSVDPADYAGGRARNDEERLRRNSSAIATMLGGFRTSMSDIMFIKTERYLHGGVAYIPDHRSSEPSVGNLAAEIQEHESALTATPNACDHDHHENHASCGADHHEHHEHDASCGHDHHEDHVACSSGSATIIPVAARDYRGFIGRLHREVKPWLDPSEPHIHTDGRELTPWFRLMTLMDPNYVRGYVAGAFWLQSMDANAALAFVDEGVDNNPEAFQLLVSRGVLRIHQARRFGELHAETLDPEARGLLARARSDFERAAELAIAQRPAAVLVTGEVWQPGWGPYREDDMARACHMTVLLTQSLGDPTRARKLAERYIRHLPDYPPLHETLR